jgi:spore photoproduct lyase
LSLAKVEFVEAQGSIVRDCPGTKHHICCGYKTIDLVEGCTLSCSYCIMKAYLNSPNIKVTRGIPHILSQTDDAIEHENHHILRFGTGELADSLALDRKLDLNRHLVEYFGQKKKALLELKSKWASIDHLSTYLNPYTVISFSVSPQQLIDTEERRTSPLYKRLRTAKKAQDLGCFVGLHFDPVIMYDGFEKDYQYLIDDIGRILDPEKIIWISLGLLRFPPKLYDNFIENKRKKLLSGEFIRGEDGKYRYIKNERIKVYRMLYKQLKTIHEDLFVYLCMERGDLWREATGMEMNDNEDLVKLFDKRVKTLFGGNI